jgi:hypothetical protein
MCLNLIVLAVLGVLASQTPRKSIGMAALAKTIPAANGGNRIAKVRYPLACAFEIAHNEAFQYNFRHFCSVDLEKLN